MARWPALSVSVVASIVLCPAAWAAPVAVSPGGTDGATTVATTCPTFSWAGSPGARGYELLVYPADRGAIDRQPVLRKKIATGATSWTPTLEACLPGDASFAWVVRVLPAASDGSGSSAPLFFRTAAVPTSAEVLHAMEVLQRWQSAHGEVAYAEGVSTAGASASAAPTASPKSISGASSIAIVAANSDTSGSAVGVEASTASASDGSAGVAAIATASTGSVAGLYASHQSPQGVAALLDAPAGGKLISGHGASGEVFSVDSTGALVASTLAGKGDGVTGVDAATLGGQPASDFATPSQIMTTVLANDGAGSELDADLLDGLHSSAFMLAATDNWVNTTGDSMTGNLSTSGSYLWSSPRTFYKSIPGSDFEPTNDTDVSLGRQWFKLYDYVAVGGAATFPNTTSFLANLELPNGATIVGVTLYAYDNASADATFSLFGYRRSFSSETVEGFTNGGGSVSLTSSGASTSIQAVADPSPVASRLVVDNQNYMYELLFSLTLPTAASGDLRFYGARVAYTLSGPAN